jgi:hypothetical protein
MNSATLCSLAGRYDNPIPLRFLAPIDFLKIPVQDPNAGVVTGGKRVKTTENEMRWLRCTRPSVRDLDREGRICKRVTKTAFFFLHKGEREA